MKLAEFKAWFAGYTENIEGAPSAEQWVRIKARVAEVDGAAITERVYVDRYWPSIYPRYKDWLYGPTWVSNNAPMVATSAASVKAAMQNKPQFDGVSAMYAAGKAEAST